jgi:hypothetical protein
MAGKTDFSALSAKIQASAEKKAKGNKTFEKIEWLKVPYGDTTFMVMPPRDDNSNFYHEVYIHHNFKDNQGNKRSYQCSRKKHGSCPICERVEALTKEGLVKTASEIKGQRTFLYNVRDIEMKKKVVGLKPSQHNEVIQELNAHYADTTIDATDPINGLSIKLSRLKASPWARARITKKVDISDVQASEFVSNLPDLDKVYIDFTPEELANMLKGEDLYAAMKKDAPVSAPKEEEDSEEAPPVVKVAPKPVSVAPKAAAAPKPVEKKPSPSKPAPVAQVKEETGDPELDAILASMEE